MVNTFALGVRNYIRGVKHLLLKASYEVKNIPEYYNQSIVATASNSTKSAPLVQASAKDANIKRFMFFLRILVPHTYVQTASKLRIEVKTKQRHVRMRFSKTAS